MILNKITTGFVIQKFDTETQKFIGQSFIAGDDVQWENQEGDKVEEPGQPNTADPYLPFEMIQPK